MCSFIARLESRVAAVDSLLCVGLDPHPAELPAQTVEDAIEFCLHLVQATADLAACFKPNSAFFEALGPGGMAALKRVIAAIPPEIPVILDAKRGDIASTARAYAQGAFQALGAHAVTVNPYLGYDAVQPFLDDPEHGAFLLCKTSNPGSADLQDLQVLSSVGENLTVYETVAHLARGWNRLDNLGLVVGATHPEAMERVRSMAPELWILAPGIGAQGGDLEAALRAGLRPDGSGVLVPMSRAISQSTDPRRSAEDLRLAINRVRRAVAVEQVSPISGLRPQLSRLADDLLDAGCIRFGQFTLKSGKVSPVYIDLRLLVSRPSLLSQVAAAYLPVLKLLPFDRLAALPYAAIPIATAISLIGGWSMVYPRKEVKTYGTKADIEGTYYPGERVVVVDDLVTTGGSKFEAIEKLSAAGLAVRDVVVLVDRQSGASRALEQSGYRLHSVFTLSQLLDHWERTGKVPVDQISAVRRFLQDSLEGAG